LASHFDDKTQTRLGKRCLAIEVKMKVPGQNSGGAWVISVKAGEVFGRVGLSAMCCNHDVPNATLAVC
jgi:hypothetical protein